MRQLKNYLSILSMLIVLSLLTLISCTPDTEKEDLICKVLVEISEGGIGVVSNNEVVSGEEVTLKAVPEETYRFVNWTVRGEEVSKENPYTTIITATTQFKPNFEKDNYALKVTAGEGGSVKSTSEGEILNGTEVTLTATPNEGYIFVNWTVEGKEVSTQNPYTTTITEDTKFKANFVTLHNVTITAGEGGTAKTSKTQVGHNGQVILTATPNEVYSFVNWTVNGVEVSTKNPYTATITTDTEFTANFINYYIATGVENGHEYVDLGLSVKWATCNVGATTPLGYGDYFAWGETTAKSSYTSSNYTYSSADAARVNWGGSWRMPTKAEQDELRNTNNCTWTWTTQNGVSGYKVTSKKNGNSIFLPAAGYRDRSSFSIVGIDGYYWSSSLNTNYSNYAYYFYFDSRSVDRGCSLYRYLGRSVRAVCE